MDFLGIESQKKKEMAEIMDNGSNSERVQEGKAKSHATETKYNNKITGSNNDVIMIDKNKNSVSSDDLGLFSNYSCQKGSFSTELRLGMASEEHRDKKKSLPACIRSVNGGTKRVVGEFIPQLDLSSVGSCSDSINLLHNQSGFGSPIEVMGRFEHKTSSDDDKDGCSGFMSSFRPAASMIPGKQSRAQLTIFYGGSVNVYDDIPADKTEQKIAFPGMKLSEGSEIQPQPATRKVNTDLPIARKHSLQRFLEKRRDRTNANAKCPYTIAKADNIKPQQNPSSSPTWLHSDSPPQPHHGP